MSLAKPRFKKWHPYPRCENLTSIPECVGVLHFQRCLRTPESHLETQLHSALSCAFDKTDGRIISVFGGFSHHASPNDSAETRRLPCGYVSVWRLDEDIYESTDVDEILETVHFTYSGLPYPSFSSCGNLICSIENNSQDKLSLLGYNFLDDDDEKEYETINLQCMRGNINGRMKLININIHHALTIIDMKLRGNIQDFQLSIWRVAQKDDELALKNDWSKRLIDVLGEINDLETFLTCCSFSPDGEYAGVLLSNSTFYQFNIHSKTLTCKQNFRELMNSGEGHVTNFMYHPLFRFRLISFGYENQCFTFDTESNSSQAIVLLEHNTKITHITYSKDGELLAVCTLPHGDVFLYLNKGKPVLLNILRTISPTVQRPLKANCADFSSTSEEMVVVYSNGDIRLWQLSRIVNLKAICRINILKTIDGDDIDNLPLPRNIKSYLQFKPVFL